VIPRQDKPPPTTPPLATVLAITGLFVGLPAIERRDARSVPAPLSASALTPLSNSILPPQLTNEHDGIFPKVRLEIEGGPTLRGSDFYRSIPYCRARGGRNKAQGGEIAISLAGALFPAPRCGPSTPAGVWGRPLIETARPWGIQRIERTQERSVGSEEVHRQGIELLCCKSMVAAVRRLLDATPRRPSGRQ
jgi:hypothetical protein